MKNIVLVFGGCSGEHYVSCRSAAGILEHYDKEKLNIITLGISNDGKWILTEASPEDILDGTKWLKHSSNKTAIISPVKGDSCLIVFNKDGKYEKIPFDGIFSVIHGKGNEDGTLQGLLEFSKVPYVGCDLESSILGYDKALTKDVVKSLGIKQADYMLLHEDEVEDIEKTVADINIRFKGRYPLFVKPAREGSSIGISKVDDIYGIKKALKVGFESDSKLLVEEGIVGREIEIAVLDNEGIAASQIGEIITEDGFYSYDAKYNDNASRTCIAIDIPKGISDAIRAAAISIFKRLGCSGLSRVDFFLQENGEFIFNEINTSPGFTTISMYPQLWENEGLSYKDLVTQLVESAFRSK